MKKLITLLNILVFISAIDAQEVESIETFLKNNVKQVSVDEEIIEQSFEINQQQCIYSIHVNNTEDDDAYTYEFNAGDLNEYKITFETGKHDVYIETETKGGKDLIRTFENEQVDGYDDDFSFYANDVEHARALVENFKNLVRNCSKMQENIGFVLGDNPGISNALTYLSENINKISVNETAISQEFTHNNTYPSLMKLHITNESEGETYIYELNASDINATTIQFDTDKEFVFLEVETKGERDLIKVFENGELEGYDDGFVVYADNIEDARKLVEVLKFYVNEAEKIQSVELADLNNAAELTDINVFISKHVNDVVVDDESFKQSYIYNPSQPFMATLKVENVNEGEAYDYNFNLADLNQNALSFDTKGNEVIIEINTSGERDLVMVHENGELDDYENEIAFQANGIEEARYIIEGFKKAVATSKEQQENSFIKGNSAPTKEQTIDFLTSAVKEVVIGEDAYKQELNTDPQNNCLVNLKVTDVSEGENLLYKFNCIDMNIHKTSFDTDGNEVFVELETIGGNDLIEVIEDGVTDDFENELSIRATDIEEARKIEMALEHLINICSEE
jgi:hypothetical protein